MSDESSNLQGEANNLQGESSNLQGEASPGIETPEPLEAPELSDMIVQSASAGEVQSGSVPEPKDSPEPKDGATETEVAAAPSETPKPALTQPEPDLSKIAAGTFPPEIFGGVPVDAAKRFLLARAGIKATSSVHEHLANVGLTWTPAQDGGEVTQYDLPRLPDVFPPINYADPLVTVADWLAAMDACAIALES